MKVLLPAEAHFAEFVQTGTDSLLGTAFLLTRDRQAAEELVQDCLVALYPKWPRVQEADSPMAYVRRSLVNRFLNQRRSKAGSELVTALVPEPPPRADFAVRLADRDQLRQALAKLPARQRAAVVLRYFHDYSDQQCAEAMDCRIGTVRSLISRALGTLRGDPAFTDSDQRSGNQEVTR
jgi:RNA polymerase sigma-70 factor (sigma-E family)